MQDWLQQRTQELVEQHHLLPAIREHAKILEEKRWTLEVQLDSWMKKIRLHPQSAEIAPLFRETRQLLDLFHFSQEPSLGEILAVNQELEKRVMIIVEKIEGLDFAHDYHFLFEENDLKDGHEKNINPLSAELLHLDALRKKLDLKVNQSQYNIIQVISSKAEYVRKALMHLEHLKAEAESKKNRLALSEQKKQEKEQSLQKLRGDKKSLDIDQLARKKKDLQQRIDQKELEILSFFSRIKPLLIQYKEREPSNGLLFSYIKDPLSSFFQDEGLFVLDILNKISVLLREGKFYLNQEEMLSSLTALEGIYNQRLALIKEEYKSFQKELKEIESETQHNFFAVRVDDAAYRLEHYTKQTAKLHEEISALNEKVMKLHYLLVREQEALQSLINTSLSRKVKITL